MLSKSKKLFTNAKKIIPSGVNSPVRYFDPYPFFVKKSQASLIWDEDGKRYIDFCNGYGALLLGHRRKEIISAVKKQLGKGTLFCAPTELEIELSKLIVDNFISCSVGVQKRVPFFNCLETDEIISFLPWPRNNAP